MCRVLAKSNDVRLSEHVRDFFRVLEGLKKVLGTYDFWGEIEELLRYTGFSHDLGKVQPAFQIKSLRNTEYQPSELSFEIPHSLASLFFVDVEALEKKLKVENSRDEKSDKRRLRLFLSAVAFHHFRENFTEYLWKDNPHLLRFCQKFVDDIEWRETLLQNLRKELKDFQKLQELLNVNLKLAEALINGLTLLDFIFLPYTMEGFPTRIGIPKEQERLFIHLSGFLQRCDHFASFCEEEGKEFPPEEEGLCREELWGKITDSLRKKSKSDTPWQEEYLEGLEDQNLILVAPTGYGKTEFAFLWSRGEKLFYTLPLRAAVNQMHKRAEEVWGGDRVALLHSDADLFFLEREQIKGAEEKGQSRIYHLSRQLALPVCVSTGDQFFPYALRPPGYERIYATFSYARLVIDEVQAYEPRAAAIIVKFTEDIVKMGGRYLLMTATLPEFVKKEIEERTGLGERHYINLYEREKERFQDLRKHLVECLPEIKAEQLVTKIIEEAERNGGQRVLVVLNTVQKAQEVYENLCKTLEKKQKGNLRQKTWLLHSRFTLEDRRKKEETLKEEFPNPKKDNDGAKILVATQVVEASLDIDADVLFTELAPMDSLVQRMGRVLRRIGPGCRKVGDGEYEASDGARYAVSGEKPNVYIFEFKEDKKVKAKPSPYLPELLEAARFALQEFLSGESIEAIDFSELTKRLTSSRKKSKQRIFRLPQGRKFLSEYDKYYLVSRLYQAIMEARSTYYEEFRKTLCILDAGYTSSQKREAQEIFRNIADVAAIPEGQGRFKSRFQSFGENVRQFLEKHCEKPTFTKFKQEILAKYLVSVPQRRDLSEEPAFQRLRDEISKQSPGFWESLDKRLKERLEDWLENVFVVPGSYDEDLGFRFSVQKGK
ncbi:CRISPR-associated helicase Cas3' [Candidatus Caldatribacterium sp. SIUC1]|uniref:CRISPR-associated helicase Cas3' n=1 Tax=Candidatus Caldatribacterium sp. SIUC1 TaxID=3418365 RepID=UPI003F691B48